MLSTDDTAFHGVNGVVSDELRFKLKLNIGEDAYTTLRVRKVMFEAWDTVGAAGTAATVAKSSFIASTFFPSTGLLSFVGLSTAATPIGWVVGAAIAGGGAWVGITRYLQSLEQTRTKVVPEFINTPLDVIGVALFELMSSLALKVAHVDGEIHPAEMEKIEKWFVAEWGYDIDFVQKGLGFVVSRLEELQISELAIALADYQRNSPDCNYKAMTGELLMFLNEVMGADHIIDEREQLAIDRIRQILHDNQPGMCDSLARSACAAKLAAANHVNAGMDAARTGFNRLKDKGSHVLSEVAGKLARTQASSDDSSR